MKDQIEKFKSLDETRKNLSEKKIRIEEQFKSKKQALSSLIKEIQEEGYDPKKLGEIIQEKEKEVEDRISKFEEDLQEASGKLAEIEV